MDLSGIAKIYKYIISFAKGYLWYRQDLQRYRKYC